MRTNLIGTVVVAIAVLALGNWVSSTRSFARTIDTASPASLFDECLRCWTLPPKHGEVEKERSERIRTIVEQQVGAFLTDQQRVVQLAIYLKNPDPVSEVNHVVVRKMITEAAFATLVARRWRSDIVWWICNTDIVESLADFGLVEWRLAVSEAARPGGQLELLFASCWTADGLRQSALIKIIIRSFPQNGSATDYSLERVAAIQEWFEVNRHKIQVNTKYLDYVSDFALGISDSCPPLIQLSTEKPTK